MKNKIQSGVTLLELIIAIGILAIATVPVYNLYTTSVRINATAYRVTMATFTAQLKMEEFVGLDEVELTKQITEWQTGKQHNGFFIQAEAEMAGSSLVPYTATDDTVYPNLIEVTVTVYESDGGAQLCREINLINVAPGGFTLPTPGP